MLQSRSSTPYEANGSGSYQSIAPNPQTDIRGPYTLEQMEEMSRHESLTNWDKVHSMTDEEIEAILLADEDTKHDMDFDWSKAVFVPAKNKKPISIRIDEDVLLFFKLQGKGYQTAINQILRDRMNELMGKDVS
jgi:uncharacterized protein (DUF4415 family)